MKKRFLYIGMPILFAIGAVLLWHARGQRGEREQAKRDVAYQTTLATYSQVVQIGSDRQSVERYLQKNGTAFRQMCCIDEPSAVADLVLIGQGKHVWWCSEHRIYVAFQFAANGSRDSWHVADADVLKRITIYDWSEGCF
jgi:hypothetical protein